MQAQGRDRDPVPELQGIAGDEIHETGALVVAKSQRIWRLGGVGARNRYFRFCGFLRENSSIIP